MTPSHGDGGCMAGGLWGHTPFRWPHTGLLVGPERLQGKTGDAALVALAEPRTRIRGRLGAHFESFSFQAAPLCQTLGFTLHGVLDAFPPRHQHFFFQKRSDPSTAIGS